MRPILQKMACLVLLSGAATLLAACSGNSLYVDTLPEGQVEQMSFLELNQDKPGEAVEAQRYLARGRYTIVAYYSPYSPESATINPRLARLSQVRNDFAVRMVNVNRPDVQGVDWQSPAMQREQLPTLPFFRIYDPAQGIRAHGRPAYEFVAQLIQNI